MSNICRVCGFGKDFKQLFNRPAARYNWFVGQHLKVSVPPAKPVMIFDGNCGFCKFWINRWHRMSGDNIEYIASQASEVGKRFPEIPQSAYERSVQLVEPNGGVYHGAEAVLRSRIVAGKKWLLWIYYHIPGARILFEWGYSFIASHRVGFSRINRLVFGEKA